MAACDVWSGSDAWQLMKLGNLCCLAACDARAESFALLVLLGLDLMPCTVQTEVHRFYMFVYVSNDGSLLLPFYAIC